MVRRADEDGLAFPYLRRYDLANALDDLLAWRDVRVARTRPFGCSLDFVS